jgi:hypothetical protein
MQTAIRCRDDQGNIIMSMREEKIKTFPDVVADIEKAIIIVSVVFIVVVVAVAALL